MKVSAPALVFLASSTASFDGASGFLNPGSTASAVSKRHALFGLRMSEREIKTLNSTDSMLPNSLVSVLNDPTYKGPTDEVEKQVYGRTITLDLKHEPVVPFGGSAPAPKEMDKNILGGKGLGLQLMHRIGVDVPPGFTLTTPLCDVYDTYSDLPVELWDAIKQAVKRVEEDMGRKYGDSENPLLFSCRSGAAVSMPGMMDTVLNIGLNSETVEGLAKATGNPRFAWDAFRRLLDMYGQVVLGLPHDAFESRLKAIKVDAGVIDDVDLGVEHLQKLAQEYKQVYEDHNVVFPEDPYDQLFSCVKAVFGSWNSERAIKYREINGIQTLIGTAANIQTMVFGNMGDNSGTGVAFSRDPGTGEKNLYGEYLINAQGEDVVAGIRTPEPISRMEQVLPDAYHQFVSNVEKLETSFQDMQDIEFTVENGRLWMLQCRSGKRTGPAALRIAIDMVAEGLCTPEEALLKIETDHIKQLLHPAFTPEALASTSYSENVFALGLGGGPGAAVGKIVFDAKTAEEWKADGESVILVRENTSPEDVGGMWAAEGVLTARGGMTSHAAVVARGWGKPCVCGCGELEIDEVAKTATVKSSGEMFNEGDVISLNGNTGEVIRNAIETSMPSLEGDMGTVLAWADAVTDACTVMANADSGPDAVKAAELGAKGIGLCRTEHMFFSPDRLPVVRRWILRGEHLDKVQDFQRSDFRDILKAMDGKPVTIRLLDPPMHEFLPSKDDVDEAMAMQLGFGTDVKGLQDKIESLHEENPMLGLRGCRLAIVRPELTAMQVDAVLNAAADLLEESNNQAKPFPRIMIPLVGSVAEFENQALTIKRVAARVQEERGMDIPHEIGTMMEVPRATLVADQIASLVDEDGQQLCKFFSYGTNDLTQMTMGISRDDAGAFIPKYIAEGIYERDPFRTIDTQGVGYLLKKSAADGRSANPALSLSVCGEHGGDPASIDFFDEVGLDYVSASPFRVPIARLAAAQAAIKRIQSSPPGAAPTAHERVDTFALDNCLP